MEKVYLCILCIALFILNFLSFKYYELYKTYSIVNEKYTQELKNNETLRVTIEEQNKAIETYKNNSMKIMKEVDELNKKVSDIKQPEYQSLEKEGVNSEDAIEWLRKKASGF